MKEKYITRIADEMLDFSLKTAGAVQVKGPKWCGKTSTAKRHARSELYMTDSEKREQNVRLAMSSPKNVLEGDTPRLIDEWQLVPTLWDAVRFEVDRRAEMGQFILTGSATPVNSKMIFHSGIGRITPLLMRPMTLFESGESSGTVSLKELFNQRLDISGESGIDLKELAFITCRGGWPRAVQLNSREIALAQAENYYQGLVQSDISKADNTHRNPEFASRIMRSYARFQGEQVSLEAIRKDVSASDSSPMSIDTVRSYVNALRQIFIVEDIPAWNPNLRSKAAIASSNTRYYVDPSIATAALGVSPTGLIDDLNTFGFIFETLCMRDLRVYAESIKGSVSHYRDSNGLECDAVVHLRDGRYGLIQMKLGADDAEIQDGIKKLKTLYDRLDFQKMPEPSFMMVLTGNGAYAYRDKESGVLIAPIGCIKP